jgi:hypothetical protein
VGAQVDPDRAELVSQPPGQRVEEPRAEPVRVEEQQRLPVAAPVERGDPKPVVLDGDVGGLGAQA